MRLKGDQGTSRQMNRRLILNLLRSEGPMSRAEIAGRTGLSPAAVTFVVSGLLEENMVIEGKASPGSTGRRPIPVDINYAGRLAVGFKLMVGSIDCVLTDLSTTVLASLNVRLADQSPAGVVDAIDTAVKRLLDQAPGKNAEVTGIGIAMPGTIDTATGTCVMGRRFGWETVPIGAMIADRVNVPVWVDDDTNAFALAQQLFGLGRQRSTVGALAIGAGISCAVVVNGAVHHGAHGSAGKLGHITFDPAGPVCECGRRGCLQTFYSEPAIVDRWRALKGLSKPVTRYDLLQAAKDGDADTLAHLRNAGENVGRMLAAFCNIVDPEIVVVGGEAVTFGDYLFDPMREALNAHIFWIAPDVMPDWEDNSWAQGAAALATQHLFDFEAVAGTRAMVI